MAVSNNTMKEFKLYHKSSRYKWQQGSFYPHQLRTDKTLEIRNVLYLPLYPEGEERIKEKSGSETKVIENTDEFRN